MVVLEGPKSPKRSFKAVKKSLQNLGQPQRGRRTGLKRVCSSEISDIVGSINVLAKNWRSRLPLHGRGNLKEIRVASDCCGYGSELIALRLLGLRSRCRPVMHSDCDSVKLALHDAVTTACGWPDSGRAYGDILNRDDSKAPGADLYVAGYPCPSFSNLGKRKGVQDRRGLVTLKGLQYIASQRPRVIVLEQVAAILQKKHSKVWTFVQKTLNGLDYECQHAVLSPKHLGVPQSRPRVYLAAVVRESLTGPLRMPEPRDGCSDLHHFLDKGTIGSEVLRLPRYESVLGASLWQKGWVLDIGSSEAYQHPMRNMCPCLTKGRCKQGGYYVPKLKRRLDASEIGRFQSVPRKVVKAMTARALKDKLPARAVDAALGDAMSQAVLMSVLVQALGASGCSELARRDFWRLVPLGAQAAQLCDRLFDRYS